MTDTSYLYEYFLENSPDKEDESNSAIPQGSNNEKTDE